MHTFAMYVVGLNVLLSKSWLRACSWWLDSPALWYVQLPCTIFSTGTMVVGGVEPPR